MRTIIPICCGVLMMYSPVILAEDDWSGVSLDRLEAKIQKKDKEGIIKPYAEMLFRRVIAEVEAKGGDKEKYAPYVARLKVAARNIAEDSYKIFCESIASMADARRNGQKVTEEDGGIILAYMTAWAAADPQNPMSDQDRLKRFDKHVDKLDAIVLRRLERQKQ
jgi:hypothetical protein